MGDTTRSSLFGRLHDGHPVAWEEFHAAYAPLVAWAARRQGLSGPDVEDVVQEVMLEVFRGQNRFTYDRSRGRFRDYLYVIARRKAQRVAARKRELPLDGAEPEAANAPPPEWEQEWRRLVLREALAQAEAEVEPKTFLAFREYGLRQRDARTVARELGISVDAVYVYKRRVIRKLQALVEAWDR